MLRDAHPPQELHQVIFLPGMWGILESSIEKYLGVHITQNLSWSLHNFTSTEWRQRPHRSLDSSPATWEEPQQNASNWPTQHWYILGWNTRAQYGTPTSTCRPKGWSRYMQGHPLGYLAVLAPHQCNVPDEPAFLCKILHHKMAVPMSSIDLVYNSRPARGKDSNQNRLQITRASTDQFSKSFGIQTIKDWNALPQSTMSASDGSEALFKSQMSGSNL